MPSQYREGEESPKANLGSAREPVSVDESQAAACHLGTEATRLPRGPAIRLASPHGVAELPAFDFRFSRQATIPAGLVRKILVRDVRLAEDEARKLL
jgi:hypothetical protein